MRILLPLALILALVIPATAGAGMRLREATGENVLVYEEQHDTNEANRVKITKVGGEVRIADTAAIELFEAPGCRLESATVALCTLGNGQGLQIRTEDLDDEIDASAVNLGVYFKLQGGAGADRLIGGPGVEYLEGDQPDTEVPLSAHGDDSLTGNGGKDFYYGQGGVDALYAQDGIGEALDCGEGTDYAPSKDAADTVTACESAALPPSPPPPTGSPTPTPTPTPAPGGGGTTPGTPPPGPDAATVAGTVSATWSAGRRSTRVRRLRLTGARSGTTATIRCNGGGCPATLRVPVSGNGLIVDLGKGLRSRHLRPGAVVRITLQRSGDRARILRWRVRAGLRPLRLA